MGNFNLINDDILDALPQMESNSFDGCLCDPPYELGFMGKRWDSTGIAFQVETWKRVFRVLKPGAMLLAFGGTRTHHRLMVAIEDAGFEIRDCVIWLYTSGFPKSLDISRTIDEEAGVDRKVTRSYLVGSNAPHAGVPHPKVLRNITEPTSETAKQWDGYGTGLKPAYEPCVVVMKPMEGTYAQNAVTHGVAGINVDGCRVGSELNVLASLNYGKKIRGLWPANVIHDGSEEVLRVLPVRLPKDTEKDLNLSLDGRESLPNNDQGNNNTAEFFYSTKASQKERNDGLAGWLDRNHHPTVKPLELTEYLARLILPPKRSTPRRLLVPFAGCGSEMIGGLKAGWEDVVGIEIDHEYVKIAEKRQNYAKNGPLTLGFPTL